MELAAVFLVLAVEWTIYYVIVYFVPCFEYISDHEIQNANDMSFHMSYIFM